MSGSGTFTAYGLLDYVMGLKSAKVRLETVWIRVRVWAKVGLQLGAVALFLLGVLAIYSAYTTSGVLNPTQFGQDVPALFGLTEHQTLLYGGIVIMMLGLGLAYRWIISDAKYRTTH
ncbi:hypothetical protein BBD46_02950 [Natrialba sp. SSL1]|nr:hypothetical protein BBD46_02950 [Natrialba sp. SSL1]